MKTKEEPRAMSTVPTATIKIDGWWNHPERHGAMFDLAASEDVKLRSTGEMSAEGHTAEGRTYRGANGLELHVGDYVIDELGERYCIMGLHEGDGATAAYADLGNSRTSLECAPCLSLRLDERPHDCDGMPIEVGDVLYQTTFEGKPIGDPMEVKRYTGNALFVKGLALPINAWSCTHREPADSYERIADDIETRYENHAFISKSTLCEWSDRIRKLSKKEGE